MDPTAAGPYMMIFLKFDSELAKIDRSHEFSACRGYRLMLYAKEKVAEIAGIETSKSGPISSADRLKYVAEIRALEKLTEGATGCVMSGQSPSR